MRKFDCNNWEKVNEWVTNNVKGRNEYFTSILKDNYYTFITDLKDGVPFTYTKKLMYRVDDFVYIYTDKKRECDFLMYIMPFNITLDMSFDKLSKDGVLDADKIIGLIKMAYKINKHRKEEQDAFMQFLNYIQH